MFQRKTDDLSEEYLSRQSLAECIPMRSLVTNNILNSMICIFDLLLEMLPVCSG
ncbi:hypothetical protein QUF80_21755 [Desulfococcaceae bacterium HSG8]|nr:hypothetical protein [Desulfococcaceae bacterium HSG8]